MALEDQEWRHTLVNRIRERNRRDVVPFKEIILQSKLQQCVRRAAQTLHSTSIRITGDFSVLCGEEGQGRHRLL